jgi:hypothetical protein
MSGFDQSRRGGNPLRVSAILAAAVAACGTRHPRFAAAIEEGLGFATQPDAGDLQSPAVVPVEKEYEVKVLFCTKCQGESPMHAKKGCRGKFTLSKETLEQNKRMVSLLIQTWHDISPDYPVPKRGLFGKELAQTVPDYVGCGGNPRNKEAVAEWSSLSRERQDEIIKEAFPARTRFD